MESLSSGFWSSFFPDRWVLKKVSAPWMNWLNCCLTWSRGDGVVEDMSFSFGVKSDETTLSTLISSLELEGDTVLSDVERETMLRNPFCRSSRVGPLIVELTLSTRLLSPLLKSDPSVAAEFLKESVEMFAFSWRFLKPWAKFSVILFRSWYLSANCWLSLESDSITLSKMEGVELEILSGSIDAGGMSAVCLLNLLWPWKARDPSASPSNSMIPSSIAMFLCPSSLGEMTLENRLGTWFSEFGRRELDRFCFCNNSNLFWDRRMNSLVWSSKVFLAKSFLANPSRASSREFIGDPVYFDSGKMR